jgi:threonine dehydrogenase-like Zn-dependent dehydrogenase
VVVASSPPSAGPAARRATKERAQHEREVKEVAPQAKPQGDSWKPGQAPSQALSWAVEALAKAGTLSIVGVYPEKARLFPIGNAVEKNLTMQMGNCPHRRYVPKLLELVVSGAVDPTEVLTQEAPLTDALEAYENFDRREAGWVKVMLQPQPSLTSR